jgi:hypothetical protein
MCLRNLITASVSVCIALTQGVPVMAQGLRISTHVYDISRVDSRTPAQIVSSSLSLIHNGRVYDSVNSADEVVIFDPTEKRFTVLNTEKGLATRPTFDEIRHLLEGLEPRTRAYLEEQQLSGNPASRSTTDSLQFQLKPKFTQSFDPMKGTLVLASESFTYRVETRKWPDIEQVDRYLTWADWTARLNYLLHPGSLFPNPRLALNDALRQHKDRLPVSVELDLRPNDPLRLRAEHQLVTKLSDDDLQRIARWEQRLSSREVREVPFRSYQQAVLVTQSR